MRRRAQEKRARRGEKTWKRGSEDSEGKEGDEGGAGENEGESKGKRKTREVNGGRWEG